MLIRKALRFRLYPNPERILPTLWFQGEQYFLSICSSRVTPSKPRSYVPPQLAARRPHSEPTPAYSAYVDQWAHPQTSPPDAAAPIPPRSPHAPECASRQV